MENGKQNAEQPTVAPASGMANETCACCPTEMCKNVCAAMGAATGTEPCENKFCQAVCTKYAQLRELHPYAKTGCDYMEFAIMFFYTHVIVRVMALLTPYKETHIVPAANYCTENYKVVVDKVTETYQAGVDVYNKNMTNLYDIYNAQAAKVASMWAVAMETADQKFPQAKTIYAEQVKPYVDIACVKYGEMRTAVLAYFYPAEKPKTE